MSGVFNPNEPGITATDDPVVARAHGLTEFDDSTGQYTAPQPPDVGQRDGWTADEIAQREARDEDPAEHDALAQGLAPGEQPAATESGTSERLIVDNEDDGAETDADVEDDERPNAEREDENTAL
jgi:hypothetical protein